ncbi:hypothetical protein HCC30_07760 [Streptomyces sp. HNM0574]|nr:hypothetical protein [Streptomyces sp. HNM0574]
MRNKLLRKPGDPQNVTGTGTGDGPPPPGAAPRRARVRNRLLVSVVLCAAAVIGAGTPTVVTASADVSDSQELVDLATLDRKAVSLSHALADERDAMVEAAAERASGPRSQAGTAGQPGAESGMPGAVDPAGATGTAAAPGASQHDRVDRLARAVRTDSATPAALKKALGTLPELRRGASGNTGGDPREIHRAYGDLLGQLRDLTGRVARNLPARAQNRTADALPELALAVEQASSVRGLLLGALAGGGDQRELVTEAQLSAVREKAALAGFEDTAGAAARDTLSQTVTGTDVTLAERYVGKLTARPYLRPSDRLVSQERFGTATSARIDRMRGVQASLATEEVKRLEALRDEDVTDLELLIALVGLCLLVSVGVGITTARSMARPLSVLRRGSQRLAASKDAPGDEEPITFHGRNDEFADVVRALNELRESAAALHERATEAEADSSYLVGSKDDLSAERDRLRSEVATLRQRVREAEQRTDTVTEGVHGTFVNLGLRTLSLVERQLGVIEGLEEKETDPDQLGTLFKLDHLATRMRRHSENLLLLAGAEHAGGHHSGPVPLLDVLRAAVSEIERYERVELGTLPPHVQVAGHAADDISHLVAELLDNAASFSPPESRVQLAGWLLESGEAVLSVQDDGIGITESRLAELNERLSAPETMEPPRPDTDGGEFGLGMGLYVVARLASRQNLTVRLRKQQQGGVAAVVTVPRALLPDRPAPGAAHHDTDGEAVASLPGFDAEANSHVLPGRRVPRQQPEPLSGTPAADETDPVAEDLAYDPDPEPALAYEPDDAADPYDGDDAEAAEPTAVVQEGGDRFVAAAEAAVRKAEQEGALESTPLRAADGGTAEDGETDTEPQHEAAGDAEDADDAEVSRPAPGVTDKGLPKRRPRNVAAATGPARPRKGGANAEELRRRLGGFQQGARSGRRDVAAETEGQGFALGALPDGGAEETDSPARGAQHDQSGAQVDGGTAEEARK